MAKATSKTLPAAVIGNIPIKGFIEFIEAWNIATAQILPALDPGLAFNDRQSHLIAGEYAFLSLRVLRGMLSYNAFEFSIVVNLIQGYDIIKRNTKKIMNCFTDIQKII